MPMRPPSEHLAEIEKARLQLGDALCTLNRLRTNVPMESFLHERAVRFEHEVMQLRKDLWFNGVHLAQHGYCPSARTDIDGAMVHPAEEVC